MVDLNKGATVELVKALSDDLRTGADGTVYKSAGAAIRAVHNRLESLIATREEFLSLFDRSYDVTSSGGETGGDTPAVITAPSAPANVTATAGDSSIAISWSAVAGAEYYAVERTTNGGASWTTIVSNITGTNYTDSTAVAGTSYRYAVTAHKTFGSGVLSSGRGALSEAVSIQQAPVAETPPAAPGNFTAIYNASDGKVYVSWDSVTGATSYTLRKKNGGVWNQVQSSSARSYTDSSVTAGASYQYEVTANKTGSSGQTLSSSAVTVNVDIPSSGTSSLTPAQQVVKNIKVGWNLANSLDATYGDVKYEAKLNYSGDDNEGLVYATGWGLPDTTQEILRTVRNKGFNAIRIPITWNHHIRAANDNADVTISAPFMSYVKGVVDNALNVGFDYIIINTHHDASQYSWGKSIDMSATTGLHWTGCPTPYQLFFTTEQETTETQNIHKKMCIHMKKLWKAIATEFSDSKYNDHLIYEGFNEILGSIHRDSANGWNYPSSDKRKEGKDGYDVDEGWVIEQTNNLNKAFVEGVRSAGGNNLTRVLSCQHYGGQDWLSGQVVGNFGFDITNSDGTTTNSADDGHIILQIHSYWNSPSTIAAGAKQNLQSVNYKYPLIIGEVGWNRGASSSALNGQANAQIYYGSGDNKTYLSASDFCDQMVRLTAAEGAKVFWWDNGRYTHSSKVELLGLLNRSDCTWYREAAANALINAANAVSDSGGNSGGSGDDSGNSGDSTTDTTPTAPTSVTATAGNGKNTITWSGATNAQYYTLERKAGDGAWGSVAQNYTGTSYTDTSVTAGTSYQYRVTAHKTGTSGVLSSSPTTSGTVTAQAGTPSENWKTAAEIVNDIKVGWVLGGALECTGAEPKTEEIGTDDEGIVYERDWTDLITTEHTFKAVQEMGFNAVRIPVTWNHHLIDDGNGNVTISPYFLKRVKKVVNWAYNLGLYVIINSHYDTATFSRSKDTETIKDENGNDTGVLRYSDYDYQRTGFTWKLDTSYQLFHADNSLDSSGNRENSNVSACEHIRKLWTQIATAFKDYGDHLLFEGFNEIKGINVNKNDDGTVNSTRIQNVNNLNKAFINAVRSVDGNERRTLLCQTFNAKNSDDVVSGFNVDIANTRDNYVAMAVAMFTDNTSEIGTTISALKAKGYPVMICSAGWSTAPSGEPAAKIDTKATFAGEFAQAVKNNGACMFWWDDYGQNHNLLNRDYTNAQMEGSLWDRLATAQAIVNNSGGTAGTGYCAGSDYTSSRNLTSAMAKTTPETAQTVVNNITVGWNLGNALDCCYDPVRMRDKHRNRVLGTAYEGIGYEIGWKDSPVTTQAMLDEVVDAGFNAIRIPITWNHHLRNKNLPYDHGQDLLDETFVSEKDGKTYYKNTGHVEVASGLSDTVDDVIISAPFLKRVKEVVDMALRAGFKYVIINTHHDTADYNTGTKKKSDGTITHPRSVDYARKITGLPTSWQSENPYQLWHASNWVWPASSGGYIATQHPTWSTDADSRGIVPAAENDFNQTLKPAFIKVWELIAKEFKDYDYRLIFEGFNEILKSTRQWGDYHAIHVQRTNELNQAFIDTIRATGKDYSSTYNQNRVLSCQTYGALKESASVDGTKFSVSDKDDNNKILLQVHYYKNSHGLFTQAVDDIRNALEDSNIPIIFGEVGWDTNGSNEGSLQNVYTDTSKNSSYEFAYKLVNSLKNKNAKVFWWDNNKLGIVDKNKGPSNRYGLLNRHNVDAATHIERWSRPALLKGLIKGSGQTIDWIENISV